MQSSLVIRRFIVHCSTIRGQNLGETPEDQGKTLGLKGPKGVNLVFADHNLSETEPPQIARETCIGSSG
jgi:hypothetical protein